MHRRRRRSILFVYVVIVVSLFNYYHIILCVQNVYLSCIRSPVGDKIQFVVNVNLYFFFPFVASVY